jgi:ATP/maltotriose-dependent transcriptional regulator MalT
MDQPVLCARILGFRDGEQGDFPNGDIGVSALSIPQERKYEIVSKGVKYRRMNISPGLPISHTKIIVPGRRPEILSRARLLDKVEELLDKRLVLITAPAGYGKTSLLIDLANTTPMPVCWFSLDSLDQEPQRFLAYFIAAIAAKFPRFGAQSNTALIGLTSIEEGLENLVITLANEIYEQVDEHFALILDDYQFVDMVPAIRNFISRFLQLSSENCHLVLASRRLPALPDMTALVARQQVGGFDLTELAFRPEEIRLLFEQNYGVSLTEDETMHLLRRTEGWITGLHLSQWSNSRPIPDLTQAARAVGVDLSDYFEQQVLSQQNAEMRSFLLQTSLLDEFDAALCDAVLGVGDWQAMMKQARQNNLFALAVGPQGNWLRYHSLFQEFLRKRIQQESPATVQAILLRLAEVSEENGDWEKAHFAIKQAGDQNALAALVERAGGPLIQNDRILTLASWLGELPEAHIRENPALLALNGYVSLVKGQVKYGCEQNNQAEALFRARGDLAGLAFTLVQRSWAHRLLGDYQSAVSEAEEAIQLTTGQPGQEFRWAEAHRMKGLALFRLGQASLAAECLEHSLKTFVRLRRDRDIHLLQMELGMTHRALGDLDSAQTNYEKALETWQKQGHLTAQTTLLNNLGVLYYFRGEYEAAVRSFQKGLDCARRSGYLRSEALLLASLGDVYSDIGDTESARAILQRAYEIAARTNDHFLINYSRIVLAGIARQEQDYKRARLFLEEAWNAVQKTGSSYEAGLYWLEAGRLCLSEKYPCSAISDLQTALENFEQGGFQSEAGIASLWLAAASSHAGDVEMARTFFESAFRAAQGGNLPASFLPIGLQVRSWLAPLAGDEKIGPRLSLFLGQIDGFQKQLASLRKRLRRLTDLAQEAAPALVVRAFGKSQVWVHGQLVTNARWRTKSVKELFFFLLQASRPLTKEQIGVVLWPEGDEEQLRLRFKNDLYRLRRAVGQETILFENNAYRFNHDLDMAYDVEKFQESLKLARSARDAEERLRAYQEAVDAVHGPYLEDIDSTWPEADRERLRQDYLDALLALAELLLERRDTEAALKTCQYALAVDKTREEFYRLMMRIHAARGDRPAVTRQYQICRDALMEEIGMPPSLETEALYRQLTA